MTTQTIDSAWLTAMHPDIVRRFSMSSFLLSLMMLLAGAFMFLSLFEVHDKSSSISMAVMILGTALVLLAVYRMFWKSYETVYRPTGSVTKECNLYFDLKHLPRLTDMLTAEDLDVDTTMRSDASGNVRLNVLISQDNRFAAVQLFQFVPYTYVAVTPVKYYTGNEAAALSAFLLRCKMG
ncbi:MAG: hypothetical protein IJ511_00135 [Bacteroides sp.]|nr:hypothetical protein [Bacteroides sp.]